MESAGTSLNTWLGPLAAAASLFGLLIFTLVAIVFACLRRTRGWIITATVSMLVSFAGLSIGAIAGWKALRSVAATQSALTSVVSEDGWISMEIPRRWSELESLHEEANLKVGDPMAEEYMIVLSEPWTAKDGVTLEKFASTARTALLESLEHGQEGAAQTLTIQGYPALRCRLSGSAAGVEVCYLHTSVQTPDGLHQIVQWTLPGRESRAWPLFEQVAASFRVTGPAPTAVEPRPPTTKKHPGTPAERVQALVAEQFGKPAGEILPSTKIQEELHADELDLVELIMAVEEEFDFELSDDDATAMTTIGDLIRYAEEHTKQP